MLLSIIVVSHNRKELLRRCVDSILAQSLPFEHEIIITDDASTDGAWELAQEYVRRFEEVKAYQCNSNDYSPSNNSERSGWNRCNGYKYAIGKYIAFIDDDDYHKKDTHIYQKQVELLELRPECAGCMANDYFLKDDEDEITASLGHKDFWETGQVISSEDFLRNNFRESHCFVFRQNRMMNPFTLYGGYFDDALLTAHFLQFGNIVCLKEAGYIYVQYKSSIMGRLANSDERFVMCNISSYIPYLIPRWKVAYMSGNIHISLMIKVTRLLLKNYQLQESNRQWIIRLKSKSYLFKVFERGFKKWDYPRLACLFLYLCFLKICKPTHKIAYRLLWQIMQ